MAFNFRVVFTGICTFVRHVEGEAMMVLLVDGRHAEAPGGERKKGLDNDYLDRHMGFLKFHLRDALGDTAPFGSEGVWYPNGHRITFHPEGEEVARFDWGRIDRIPDLDAIAPGLAEVDTSTLRPSNPRSASSRVLAQVVIRHGVIQQDPSSFSETYWTFHDHLAGSFPDGKLAHRLIVDMGDLDALTIRTQATSGAGPAAATDFLTLEDLEGTVTLEVCNLCETNPLGWAQKRREAEDDTDFRWHYELLAQQGEIRRWLRSSGQQKQLPFPRPIGSDGKIRSSPLSMSVRELLQEVQEFWTESKETLLPDGELKDLQVGELLRAYKRGEAALGNNCYGSFAADSDLSVAQIFEEVATTAPVASRASARADADRQRIRPWLARVDPRKLADIVRALSGIHTRYTGSEGYMQAVKYVTDRVIGQGRPRSSVRSVPFRDGSLESVSVEVVFRSGSLRSPILLATAHLDSINDRGGPTAPAPGANDNASGVAGIIEIQRILEEILAAGGILKSEIRLLLFGGEEQGLVGSGSYRRMLEQNGDLERLTAMLNLDMIAAGRPNRAVIYGEEHLGAELEKWGEEYAELSVGVEGAGDSDHLSFHPLRAVSSAHEGDDLGYRHTENDVVNGRLNFGLAAAISRMNLAYLLENGFGQIPESPNPQEASA